MAGPSHFFDPFYRIQETANLLDSVHLSDQPEKAKLINSNNERDLPILGQGTISVSSDAKNLLRFAIKTADNGNEGLFLDIGTKECLLYQSHVDPTDDTPPKFNPATVPVRFDVELLKPISDVCLSPPVTTAGNIKAPNANKTTYWLSLDRSNGVIMYGKYYANRSMTLLQVVLKDTLESGVKAWKKKEGEMVSSFEWLENLKEVYVIQDPDDKPVLPQTKIHPLPVVTDLSPFVISDHKVSLMKLERGDYTVFANLPPACQLLYHNVAGPNITLEVDDFPFAAAIERSVSTPGLWGFETLNSKSEEFGKPADLMGTYLRITLGTNQGDSPGIPYVLEIWPGGHYSPIHDHGDACAVIKVLHGMIKATYYDSLTSHGGPHEMNTAELTEGMVTWIGPQNYQIHKLHNDTKTVCCTIQCYRFPDEDKEHYEKFNYVDAKNQERAFDPNSDMAFGEFENLMRMEWYLWQEEQEELRRQKK